MVIGRHWITSSLLNHAVSNGIMPVLSNNISALQRQLRTVCWHTGEESLIGLWMLLHSFHQCSVYAVLYVNVHSKPYWAVVRMPPRDYPAGNRLFGTILEIMLVYQWLSVLPCIENRVQHVSTMTTRMHSFCRRYQLLKSSCVHGIVILLLLETSILKSYVDY